MEAAQLLWMLTGAAVIVAGRIVSILVEWQRAKNETTTTHATSRSSEADATVRLLEGSEMVIEQLRSEIARLSDNQGVMRVELDVLWRHVGTLEQLMIEKGLTPPARPTPGEILEIYRKSTTAPGRG